MKKSLTLLNCFLCFFCIQTKAGDVVVDGISYDVDLSTMEATVVSGDYDFRDIIIPKSFTYNGRDFSVVTLGEYAFSRMGANKLTSISLPNTIKDIKEHAFGKNEYLTKLIIPNSVEKISPWNSFVAKDSIIFEDGESSIEFVWHKNSYRGFFLLDIYILAAKSNPFSMELSLGKSLFGDWQVVII